MITYIRLISLAEGVSLLFLLCLAMPFKYINGDTSLMKIAGPLHGMLFMLLMGATFFLIDQYNLKKRTLLKAFCYSVIPFGMIKYDQFIRDLKIERQS